MKIAFVLLIVFATVGHYVSGQAAGLREYELQSCLSNCYNDLFSQQEIQGSSILVLCDVSGSMKSGAKDVAVADTAMQAVDFLSCCVINRCDFADAD